MLQTNEINYKIDLAVKKKKMEKDVMYLNFLQSLIKVNKLTLSD